MRSSSLDRRVRKEARLLVREATRRAPAPDGLAEASRAVSSALAAGDLALVRRGLPLLDELVSELPRPRRSLFAEYTTAIVTLVLIVGGLRFFVIEAFKIPSTSMLPTLEINDHIFVSKLVYGLRIPVLDVKPLAFTPDRGEVIVFLQPCENRDFIKRVIGLPGDTVEVRCNTLHVNGRPVPSSFVSVDRCDLTGEDDSFHRCARYRESLGGYTYDTFYSPDRPQLAPNTPGPNDFPQHTALPTCASKTQRPGKLVMTRQPDAASPCGPHLHYVVPPDHVFVMGDYRDGSSDSRRWGSVPIENIKGKALFRFLSYRTFSWSGMRWGRIGDLIH